MERPKDRRGESRDWRRRLWGWLKRLFPALLVLLLIVGVLSIIPASVYWEEIWSWAHGNGASKGETLRNLALAYGAFLAAFIGLPLAIGPKRSFAALLVLLPIVGVWSVIPASVYWEEIWSWAHGNGASKGETLRNLALAYGAFLAAFIGLPLAIWRSFVANRQAKAAKEGGTTGTASAGEGKATGTASSGQAAHADPASITASLIENGQVFAMLRDSASQQVYQRLEEKLARSRMLVLGMSAVVLTAIVGVGGYVIDIILDSRVNTQVREQLERERAQLVQNLDSQVNTRVREQVNTQVREQLERERAQLVQNLDSQVNTRVSEQVNTQVREQLERERAQLVQNAEFLPRATILEIQLQQMDKQDRVNPEKLESALDEFESLYSEFVDPGAASDDESEDGTTRTINLKAAEKRERQLANSFDFLVQILFGLGRLQELESLVALAPNLTRDSTTALQTLLQSYGRDLIGAPGAPASWSEGESYHQTYLSYQDQSKAAREKGYPEIHLLFEAIIWQMEGKDKNAIKQLLGDIDSLNDEAGDNYEEILEELASESFVRQSTAQSQRIAVRANAFIAKYQNEYTRVERVAEALNKDASRAGANLVRADLEGANLVRADLEGANLVRANLEGANLVRANLAGANLFDANLFDAKLAGAKLAGANLEGADLIGANLAGANLVRTHLAGANLEGADLIGANLAGANLVRANLAGAHLEGANLIGANLIGANLIGANLIGANLEGAYLIDANLEGAYLIDANLEGATLRDANLEGATLLRVHLEGATLRDANLEGAKLFGANLEGATLRDANLEGAKLFGANLEGATLRDANLEGATLEGATLRDANLEGANLFGATLRDANLEGATLRDAKLANAIGLTQEMLDSARPSSWPRSLPEGLSWPFERGENSQWRRRL